MLQFNSGFYLVCGWGVGEGVSLPNFPELPSPLQILSFTPYIC